MRHFKKNLFKQEEGVIAMVFAICLAVIIPLLILSVDGSKTAAVKTKFAFAQDAAMIGAAVIPEALLPSQNGVKVSRFAYAQKYISMNVGQKYMDIAPDIVFSENDNTITADSTSIYVSSAFDPATKLAAGSVSQVTKASGSITAPTLAGFVLDTSGSMSGSIPGAGIKRIDGLRTAMDAFIDYLAPSSVMAPNFEMSIVAFSTTVDDYMDFSNSADDTKRFVSDLSPNGETCGSCGLNKSKNLFDTKLVNNKYANYKKYVVFMTDGVMNEGDITLSTCITFKNAGYTVIGISYGPDTDENSVKTCASPPDQNGGVYYYHASNNNSLIKIFMEIAQIIGKARILK